jgi:hypothetical protein
MANIGNDIAYMKNGGGIELFSATDTSGDVAADDISRWIPDTTEDLTAAVTVYDQKNQKILLFIDSKILVLFKDILATGGGSPWTFYTTSLTNADGTNIFSTTKGVKYLRRPGLTTRSVYFGDIDGNIYDLNGAGSGDNGSDIHSVRKTKLLEMDRGKILIGNIQYRRIGEFSCSLVFQWSNEYNTTISSITLKGPPATGETVAYWNLDSYWDSNGVRDEDYWNEGFAFAGTVSKQNFSPAGRADGYFLTVEQETTVQYQIDHIQVP